MRALAFAVCMLLAGAAQAQITGNTLHNRCLGKEGSLMEAWCVGYIQGVAENSPHICPPSGATIGQSKDIVVKFLKEQPQERHPPATKVVVVALNQAGWGCPTKK